MQLQKDMKRCKLFSYALFDKINVRKISLKKIASFFVIAAVTTVLLAVNSLADYTGHTLKKPDYFSNNAVIAELVPNVTYSITNRGAEEIQLTTMAAKLGEVLKMQNILLDDTCVVNYDLDTMVFDGMKIVIDSITYEEVSRDETVPFSVTTVEVQNIPKNTEKILTKGENGTSRNTYKKKYVNGVFESEEIINQVVVNEPITEVVERGVGGTFTGKDGVTYEYSYYLDVVATCYGEADGYSGSITATGTQARVGVIAVDPKTIPLGSKVFVTGSYRELGVCYAEDTGGFIKGNRIDVYLEGTLQQLLEFGRRDMRVYILE